jgi:hypothetical protein
MKVPPHDLEKGTTMREFVLAVLSYFVLTVLWAYPWHILWFHDLYLELGAMTRDPPIIPLGMAAIVIQGVVIAYLYPFYYHGGHPVVQGIKFSLIIGLMVYTVMAFATAAKFQIEPVSKFLVYHAMFQFIQFILTGTALGLIYGRQPNPSQPTT